MHMLRHTHVCACQVLKALHEWPFGRCEIDYLSRNMLDIFNSLGLF